MPSASTTPVALIEQRLYRLGQKEVPSQLVGEMAMDALAEIDQVAYVRFASVYKSFCDVSEIHPSHRHLAQRRKKNAEPRARSTFILLYSALCVSILLTDIS